jgi:hypothetical protein
MRLKAAFVPRLRLRVRAAAIVFAAVTLSCFYFFTGGGWNQASRFDMVRAVVEQGTFRIDAYHQNTGDKSLYQGHYYSDKAPGTSLLAVPFVALSKPLFRRFVEDSRQVLFYQARTAVLVCATIPTAVAALAVFFISLRLGSTRSAAGVGAIVYALGTPAWIYGTYLWGNQLAAACLMIALLKALALGQIRVAEDRIAGRSFLVGFIGGWAVVTEFMAAFALAVIGAAALERAHAGGGWTRVRRVVAFVIAGGIPPLLVLLGYNTLAFGTPLHIGYAYEVGFEGLREGFLGMTYPKADVVFALLFGLEKGLLFLSPVLFLAPLGFAWMNGDRQSRTAALASAGVFLCYLFEISSYHYWRGGWSYGPRYLGAPLPFLCLALPPLWDRRGFFRTALVILGMASIFLTLVAVAVQPMTPEGIAWPLRDLLWPAFAKGAMSTHTSRFFDDQLTPSFNLGEALGLHGLESLVPLLSIWTALGALWWLQVQPGLRCANRRDGAAVGSSR